MFKYCVVALYKCDYHDSVLSAFVYLCLMYPGCCMQCQSWWKKKARERSSLLPSRIWSTVWQNSTRPHRAMPTREAGNVCDTQNRILYALWWCSLVVLVTHFFFVVLVSQTLVYEVEIHLVISWVSYSQHEHGKPWLIYSAVKVLFKLICCALFSPLACRWCPTHTSETEDENNESLVADAQCGPSECKGGPEEPGWNWAPRDRGQGAWKVGEETLWRQVQGWRIHNPQ